MNIYYDNDMNNDKNEIKTKKKKYKYKYVQTKYIIEISEVYLLYFSLT